MARSIEISDNNFKRIQEISEPLVDTVDTVLARLLDSYEKFSKEVVPTGTLSDARLPSAYLDVEDFPPYLANLKEYDAFNPPDLTHTGIKAAKFAGTRIDSPSWNVLLDVSIRQAVRKLGGVEHLRKVVPINVMEGKKTDQGYRYLADVNVSVQGQSAKDAWRATAKIARRLAHTVHVQFYWQNKEGAERPGEVGIFQIVGAEM